MKITKKFGVFTEGIINHGAYAMTCQGTCDSIGEAAEAIIKFCDKGKAHPQHFKIMPFFSVEDNKIPK